MTKLIVYFRNSAKAPEEYNVPAKYKESFQPKSGVETGKEIKSVPF
jgi:hypothetical protein